MSKQREQLNKLFKKALTRIRSRNVGLTILWILFICAAVGTYRLSRTIELRGNNAASAFSSTGIVHEISLYKDMIESTEIKIRTGEEVVFRVRDASRHNIAEERVRKTDARIESGEFGGEESYSLVFQTRGTMSFYDRLNQDIRITVIVE